MWRLDADEKGHLQPLPVAVDIVETERAQPLELCVYVECTVGWVLVLDWLADRREERQVQALGWDATCSKFANTPPGSSKSKTSP